MAKGIRYSIGLKLSLLVSFLLAVSLSLITVLVALLVSADVRLTAESNNWTMNHWSVAAAGNVLNAYHDKSLFFIRSMDVVSQDGEQSELAAMTERFFRLNPDISCIAFIGETDRASGMVINERFTAGVNFNGGMNGGGARLRSSILTWLESRTDYLDRARGGSTLLFNTNDVLGFPSLAMIFPLPQTAGFNFNGAAVLFFSPDDLERNLNSAGSGNAENISLIVNGNGEMIFQPPEVIQNDGVDYSSIVRESLERNVSALQTIITSPCGQRFYTAFEHIPGMDVAVLTLINQARLSSRVNTAIITVSIIGALALALSVFFIAFYSKTISRPLKALINGAQTIENGNYLPDLQVKSSDEVGILTGSFISMGRGLVNFERFTNKQLVTLARREQLSRSGEKRTVTVCFTMIQNFKALTLGMKPDKLVDFVNQLLSSLVPCITKTGGLVDKFLTQNGIVIMCLWGAAKTTGSPVSDAFNCIRSTMMMRNAIKSLNLKQISAGMPGVLIKMGCGINTGELIVGQMVSEERMEYTVIGDTVNQAARIQEPNEEFDTDILITEDTYRHVGKFIKAAEMPSLDVKGKSDPMRVYSVINIKNYYGPSSLEEVRKSWRI